jgi:hypothetical protein
MAEPIISDLALRGVGSCPYEPEAQRARFLILNKRYCEMAMATCKDPLLAMAVYVEA